MKDGKLLDLYSDYLISAFGQTTSTGLSELLEGQVSHDQVQRSLAGEKQTSADLWRIAKPHVRKIERANGVMIVDDSISEKPYTDENDIICWHYDHSQQRTVKGINFVTSLYHCQGVSLPVGFEIVQKTERKNVVPSEPRMRCTETSYGKPFEIRSFLGMFSMTSGFRLPKT